MERGSATSAERHRWSCGPGSRLSFQRSQACADCV